MCKKCGKATSMKARQMILDEAEAQQKAFEKRRIEQMEKQFKKYEENEAKKK